MKTANRLRIVYTTSTLTVIVFLVTLVALSQTQSAHSATNVVAQRDYGAWSYTVVRQPDNTLYGTIHCDFHSVQGLNNYAIANKTLADQLVKAGGQADVEVTFRSPVEPTVYRKWASKVGITLFSEVTLRAVTTKGDRINIRINPGSSDPLPQQPLDLQISKPAHADRTLSGVIQVKGKINAKQLPALAGDPLVFITDVTPNIVRKDLRTAGISAGELEQATIVNSVLLFWGMEDLGLDNFR